MATVSVSVNVNKRELERLIRSAPGEARAAAKRQAQDLRDDVRRRMPRRTGTTARNTEAVQRSEYSWAVEIPEVPGRFLIEGTRPHLIRPRNGRVLRFMGRGGGVVFARLVRHPGTKPYPFARDAAKAAQRTFPLRVLDLFRVR